MAYQCVFDLAERVGFEPTRPFGLTDFELVGADILENHSVSQSAVNSHSRENLDSYAVDFSGSRVDNRVDSISPGAYNMKGLVSLRIQGLSDLGVEFHHNVRNLRCGKTAVFKEPLQNRSSFLLHRNINILFGIHSPIYDSMLLQMT